MNSAHWKHEFSAIDVDCSTIDHEVLALGLNHLDLIKIDVEGFEIDVLNGGLQTIPRFNPVIFLEFNSWAIMALKNINPRDFLEYLGKEFSHIYCCNIDGTLRKLTTSEGRIRFLHDNLIVHGCVNDLVVFNSPDYFSGLSSSTF